MRRVACTSSVHGSHRVRGVEIGFAQQKLAKVCNSGRDLVRRFGPEGAKRVQLRLAQLEAAPTLEDLRQMPGRCHELVGDLKGSLSVDLHGPFRLLFAPSANPPPHTADGGLDWSSVDAITVTDILDTHDK
jgi:plasmid maintenance system killer protein